MIPPKGQTQMATISHAGAVPFVWALRQLRLPVLVLNISDSVHSCPILGNQELLGSVNGRKTDSAARSKRFLLLWDGEQDCMAGNAGGGKERWEALWLCSRWSLGKDGRV